MPEKIAFVTETWAPEINGVALSTQQLVKQVLAAGHEMQLFRPRQTQKTQNQITNSKQVQEYLLPGFVLPFYKQVRVGLPATNKLKKIWASSQPDIVQVVTEGPLGLSAVRVAKRLGLPVISEFHTNFHQYCQYYSAGFLSGLLKFYLRWLHNQCDLTLVPTNELKCELEGMGFTNLAVLGRGIDSKLFQPQYRNDSLRKKWGLKSSDLAVLYVGRIAAEKNLRLAVSAFREIQKANRSARFILVGDGPARAKLEENNVDFVFCGMKKGTELAMHYASGDIFLSPSKTETYGNTILEAMASGLSVVSFDYAASRKHIINSVNGFSVPLGNDEAFINSAVIISNDEISQEKISHAARETAEKVSWKNISEQYELMINQLTDRVNNHGQSTALPQSG